MIISYEAYQYHRENLEAHPDKFGASFKKRVAGGLRSREDYGAALAYQARLRAAFAAAFASGVDVIATPGRESPPDTFEALFSDTAKRPAANRIFNLTGMPALTLPMGFTADGLPLGLQIAGNHFREDQIYQVAAAYEDATRWCDRHPEL